MNANDYIYELYKKFNDNSFDHDQIIELFKKLDNLPEESLLNTKDLPQEIIYEIKKDIENGVDLKISQEWTIKKKDVESKIWTNIQTFNSSSEKAEIVRCPICGKQSQLGKEEHFATCDYNIL